MQSSGPSRRGFQTAAPDRHSLTCALRLPPGSSQLFPGSPQTPSEMTSFGCWGLPTALLALICCSGSGEKTFEVHMWPERLVVKPTESWEVNCSTSCTQPEKGGIETTLKKTLLESERQWQRYLISNISEDTVLYCHYTCAGKQLSSKLSVVVYQPPEQVVLKLQPTWVAVGSSFTIECRAPTVEPLESLTLTLLRGNKTLHSKTFEGTAAVPQEATATFNGTADREDGQHNFSCLAKLDLRSRGGGIFHWVSEPQGLEIYVPPQDTDMIIIITVVSVLLLLFVTAVLLCFAFGQHWRQKRTGTYGVRAAWKRLPRAFRAQSA